MPDHGKRKHALCGASSASRWVKCPGSIYMGWGIKVPLKPWTAEGTRAHELAEIILRAWAAGKLTDEFIKSLFDQYKDTEEPETYPWSDGKRRVNMVQYCLEYINVVQSELAMMKEHSFRIESQLDLDNDLQMFGTLDFLATGIRVQRLIGLVVDFKYGKGVQVKAGEENWQLAYYAAMVLLNSTRPLEAVRTVICQPRAAEKVSVQEFTRAELMDKYIPALRKGAMKAFYQAASREPELNPGEHCRFCPAKNTCPSYVELPPPNTKTEAIPESLAAKTEFMEDIETTLTPLE